ncbi:hypothetical protein PG996_003430 [Apiospora saccharicola]|uniref:Uncharacterized protein n=1 Tax=Apiospora saccharicola TaxID=335842 RepID=A0ABR1W188_9PEZI
MWTSRNFEEPQVPSFGTGFPDFLVIELVIATKMLNQMVSTSKSMLAAVKLAEFARELRNIFGITIYVAMQDIHPGECGTTLAQERTVLAIFAM